MQHSLARVNTATDYDLKAIFTSGAADIAELAYGRTGDDGACLIILRLILQTACKRNLKREY